MLKGLDKIIEAHGGLSGNASLSASVSHAYAVASDQITWWLSSHPSPPSVLKKIAR